MNKRALFIIFIDIVIVLLYLTNTGKPGETIGEKISDAVSKQVEITMLFDDGVDVTPYTNVLNKLPYDLLNTFKEENWTLCIIGDVENGEAGYTDYSLKRIVINANLIGQEESNLIHEFGHFYDYTQDFISSSDEFMGIYKENSAYIEYEYRNVTDLVSQDELSYSTKNERELLAATFKDYILNPSYLKENYPDIYDFFKSKIS